MSKKKTHEEFCKEIYTLIGNEYTVKGKYIANKIKIMFRHNICGNEWEVRPNSFLRGLRCPKCQHRNIKKTTEEFKQEVFNLVGNEYTVFGEYIGANTKIKMKHNICNNEYMIIPVSFLSNRRCEKCAIKKRAKIQTKTNNTFIQEVYNLVDEEYKFLEEYKGTNNKIKVIHNKCNNQYFVTPNLFLHGSRCPFCKESINESKIRIYLTKLNINFKVQYKFKDCKYKKVLRYDFVLFDNNNKVIGIIEYDGQFHDSLRSLMKFHKDKIKAMVELHHNKYRDAIKNTYCKINDIPLLRINHKEEKYKYNLINQFLRVIYEDDNIIDRLKNK